MPHVKIIIRNQAMGKVAAGCKTFKSQIDLTYRISRLVSHHRRKFEMKESKHVSINKKVISLSKKSNKPLTQQLTNLIFTPFNGKLWTFNFIPKSF